MATDLNIQNKEFLYQAARALLDLMGRNTTDQEAAITRMDPAAYFSEERFRAEKDHLFRKTPLVVAFSCELPSPGDFRLNEEAGVPLLISRDKAGKVHVFLNACRHRAVKVTTEPCGNAARFTCPYHAWTYAADGALVALPGDDVFGEVDRSTLGLVEFPCEERYGMIFAVLTPGAQLNLAAFLGGGSTHLAEWHMERFGMVVERPLETTANWKLALDTYTQNYHFHVLHAADFGYKVKNCAAHWRFGDRDQHWVLAWPSKSLETLRGVPEDQWGQVNAHFSVLYYIFPNTVLGLNADTCTAKHVWPGREVGEQTTQMKGFARTANPTPEIAAKVRERIDVFYKVLQQEDYWVCGQAWENIRTGLVPELLYGRNEPALTWLHRSLDQAMEGFSRAETARVR